MNRKIFAIIIFLVIFFSTPFISSKFGFNSAAVERIAGIAWIGIFCILFSGILGFYTGQTWPIVGHFGTPIDRPSPPGVVEFLGWILLLVPIIIFLIAVV